MSDLQEVLNAIYEPEHEKVAGLPRYLKELSGKVTGNKLGARKLLSEGANSRILAHDSGKLAKKIIADERTAPVGFGGPRDMELSWGARSMGREARNKARSTQ